MMCVFTVCFFRRGRDPPELSLLPSYLRHCNRGIKTYLALTNIVQVEGCIQKPRLSLSWQTRTLLLCQM